MSGYYLLNYFYFYNQFRFDLITEIRNRMTISKIKN